MSDSPFKFLNAFEKKDKTFFFGREEECNDLYEMTYDSRLILLYGASGTGKTSLIQCGLSNKFRDTRWLGLYIRRDKNIMVSLRHALTQQLTEQEAPNPSKGTPIISLIETVYSEKFKPIYLLFDQFEELFILNPSKDEQQEFFETIKAIQESNVSCSVLLIMREEFIAHLWEYEKMLPYLFDHRYRIEKMRSSKMKEVIAKTLKRLEKKEIISLKEESILVKNIIQKLEENQSSLELTYLQVYLDRLYRLAKEQSIEPPLFSPSLLENLGDFEDLIQDLLTDQLLQLEQELGEGKEGIPLRLLGALVTDAQTKKVLSEDEIELLRQQLNLSPEELKLCLNTFVKMRILRQYD